jgi:transcriptional regulator GlxA family with amidase domain
MRHCLVGNCDISIAYLWRMVNISILVLRNAMLSSVVDSANVFRMVNEFLTDDGKAPLFDIKLVGLNKEAIFDGGLYSIKPEVHFENVAKTDLIIIPSLTGFISTSVYLNKDYCSWISTQYKNGAEVASLCTGAFLLAFSGILKNRQCTTHWAYANEFRYYYPSVTLIDEKMITDQDGLYSSGGSNAYWNLLLHLVEKYTSRAIAIRTAKYFVIDLDKDNQSPFVIFHGLKNHEDETILKSQQFIERQYKDKLNVDQIAAQFNLTRRTFERRFKKATRNTVAEYIQRVKVEAAKKQLEIGRKSINEIMYDVGYADIQAFREVFKRITGMTPVDYRNKYKVRA